MTEPLNHDANANAQEATDATEHPTDASAQQPDPETAERPFYFKGLGGTSEVGASSQLIAIGKHRILVDAGARPGLLGDDAMPAFELLTGHNTPSSVVLTHAHLDHVGMLPILHRRFPHLKIHCTHGTALLAAHVLADSLNIQVAGGYVMFTQKDVLSTLNALEEHPYGEPFESEPGVTMTLYPAGHLPGAAQVLIEADERRVLHTGDISNATTAITEAAYRPGTAEVLPGGTSGLDAIIIESTYGDTTLPSRKAQIQTLIASIREVVGRGGKVLIPSFALGRAQELAVLLAQAMRTGDLKHVPIYLDGMTRKVTQTMEEHLELLPGSYRNAWNHGMKHVLTMGHIHFVENARRDDILNSKGAAVVIASGGMLTAGVSPVYARAWLGDPNNALMIVGYQDAESPGARLLALEGGGTVSLPGPDGQFVDVDVHASVSRYYLSAHADRTGLMAHIAAWDAKKVVLVHGDAGPRTALYKTVLSSGTDCAMPQNGEAITLARTRTPRNRQKDRASGVVKAKLRKGETFARVMHVNGTPALIVPIPPEIDPKLIPDGEYRIVVHQQVFSRVTLQEIDQNHPDEIERHRRNQK